MTVIKLTNIKHVGHATSHALHHACYALGTCGAKSHALFLLISDCRDLCLNTQTIGTLCCTASHSQHVYSLSVTLQHSHL